MCHFFSPSCANVEDGNSFSNFVYFLQILEQMTDRTAICVLWGQHQTTYNGGDPWKCHLVLSSSHLERDISLIKKCLNGEQNALMENKKTSMYTVPILFPYMYQKYSVLQKHWERVNNQLLQHCSSPTHGVSHIKQLLSACYQKPYGEEGAA